LGEEKLECICCKEEITEDGCYFLDDYWDEYGYTWLRDKHAYGVVCYPCLEALDNSLLYVDEHGKILLRFTDEFYGFDLHRYEGEPNDVMPLLERIMQSYGWKPIDPWRGHYEAKRTKVSNMVMALTGWHDAFSPSEYSERLKDLLETITPIVMVYPRSSNVCVCYFDVWVPIHLARAVQRSVLGEERKEVFSWSRGICIQPVELPKVNSIPQCDRPH